MRSFIFSCKLNLQVYKRPYCVAEMNKQILAVREHFIHIMRNMTCRTFGQFKSPLELCREDGFV